MLERFLYSASLSFPTRKPPRILQSHSSVRLGAPLPAQNEARSGEIRRKYAHIHILCDLVVEEKMGSHPIFHVGCVLHHASRPVRLDL